MNENEKRKEKILQFITEFGTGLAAQDEVKSAILDKNLPLWQRLIIPDMVLCFEGALRKNLETVMPAKTDVQQEMLPGE